MGQNSCPDSHSFSRMNGFSFLSVFPYGLCFSSPPHDAEMRPDSSSGNYKPDYIKQQFNKITYNLVRLYMVCYYMVNRKTLWFLFNSTALFSNVFLAVVE